MFEGIMPRRGFLSGLASVAVMAGASTAGGLAKDDSKRVHIASSEYSWTVFYTRAKRNFRDSLKSALGELRASGIDGLEPMVDSPADIDRLVPLLREHHLEMRSLYMNSVLHEAQKVDQSIQQILAVAGKARAAGTRIVVTNPSPIRWGAQEDKNDEQLKVQARALEKLGQELKLLGLTLAYHNHDIEMRNGAREFHHMMVGTDPKLVTLCLDAHWIYRGSGNSELALSDIMRLYGRRVSEVHIRQSLAGIWSETLGDGDIDYRALAAKLRSLQVKPHLVVELALEKGTPHTMDPVAAHRQSIEYARRVFAGF
ncbi:MAG: sugar phosphate isomerase/epimerase family protein [Acidobacteriota bacterium]